jgi:hypothetical protein
MAGAADETAINSLLRSKGMGKGMEHRERICQTAAEQEFDL